MITARSAKGGQTRRHLYAALVSMVTSALGCSADRDPGDSGPPADAPADAEADAPPSASAPPATSEAPATPEVMPAPRCSPDMVLVTPRDVPIAPGDPRAAYCVDRYEAVLMDSEGAGRVPPYYTPSRKAATATAKMWESLRFEMGDPEQQAVPLPALPAWMLAKDFIPKAVVRKDATPNGHVSGEQAALACRTAGKRLCTHGEWRSACRGARGEMFPYGPDYVQGKCNVFREAHPAAILHGKASIGHSDPRLNRVTYRGRALLMKTGDSPDCKSRWGDDAIYDMVGNLDEWLEDPEGSFAGGFYARASKKGCDWRTSAHPNDYSDYSTGVRCCADLP